MPVSRAEFAVRGALKRILGEWGYRQLRDLKDQLANRKLARLRANPAPTVFRAALVAALGATPEPSDIVDHIGPLFTHVLAVQAQLVVELGTRGGVSTRALLAAVCLTGGRVLSVDIEDCAGIGLPQEMKSRWHFRKADDVAFARMDFEQWCRSSGLEPRADIVFIDTSHLYEHTVQEIAAWHDRVRPGGLMIFHDTNMGEGVYLRRDGSFGYGWDNQRGVIRAIEEFLGSTYDERKSFVDVANGWVVSHDPFCNGLTVLYRMSAMGEGAAGRIGTRVVASEKDA